MPCGRLRDVALDERHVGKLAGARARQRQQLGHGIHRHDLADVRRDREREGARARAGVQHVLVAARRDEAPQPGAQLVAPLLLQRCEQRGGVGEAAHCPAS